MKTFLQICQDARRETGISGSGPVSVLTATGIEKKIVGYVVQGFIDVQIYRPDWPWMYKDFSFNTSPNKQRYSCVELNLTDVEKWDFSGASIYRTVDGKAGEVFLGSTTYESWWNFHRIGLQKPAQPSAIFSDPATGDLMFFPAPDAEYTVNLRYYRAAQRLAANGDIPRMPTNEAWADIIMWRALWYYGYQDGAPDILAEAEMKWDEMIHTLDNRYGQNIFLVGRPIA